MPDRITERDLILPALYCIEQSDDEISTTALSQCLRDLLNPQGEDLEILSGRKDDKFSQKVRNLRSHNTLEQPGLAKYERRGSQGYWSLTSVGKDYLDTYRYLLEYLIGQGFEYAAQQSVLSRVPKPAPDAHEQFDLFDETASEQNIQIAEGKQRVIKQKVYERSNKLRQVAIQRYQAEGRITCHACGFDFAAQYGSYGDGFIEIHHIKPIVAYSDTDLEKTLEEALENVVPLCSNCHRMIHRNRNKMLSVDELREIIRQAAQDA